MGIMVGLPSPSGSEKDLQNEIICRTEQTTF